MTGHASRQAWTKVRIGDVGRVVSGATPRTDNPAYWNGNIRWATPRDLSGHQDPVVRETAKAITPAGIASCSAETLPIGSVLFSSRAPIGLVAITGVPMATNQGFKSVVPGAEIDPRFLYWTLRHLGPGIAERAPGTTFKEVNKATMEDVRIPVPPLPEQRRIAALLDKADAIRRKRQQAIRLADAFLRSAFLDMFGDPVTNPKGWPVLPLGEVIVAIEGGWSAQGEDRAPKPGEKAVLKVSAVTSGSYRPDECKAVLDVHGRCLVVPEAGDVLFSRANTRELVAATCLVDRTAQDVFLPDKLWRLVPDTKTILGPCLRFALSSASVRSLIRSRATGTSGSMLNVSMAKLRAIPIPVPDLQSQERFGRLLARLYLLEQRERVSESACETLADALVQRAFSGGL